MKEHKATDTAVELSDEQVRSVVQPESAVPATVEVGGKQISITPLKRGWHSLFLQAALPLFEAELSAPEMILKSIEDGSFIYTASTKQLIGTEIEADAHLDRSAAVIIASKTPGSEKDQEAAIKEQISWLRENCYTQELQALVRAQADKERLVARVGERLPARFAGLLNLAGMKVTEDSLKQLLTSFSRKLQAPTGSGASA